MKVGGWRINIVPLPAWKQNQENSIVMQCSYWAVYLHLAELVEESGPKHVFDLATATGTRPSTLHRVLQILAHRKVFIEVESRVFCLGPEGARLKQGQPFSELIVTEDWKSIDSNEEWYLSVENLLFPQGEDQDVDWGSFFPSNL